MTIVRKVTSGRALCLLAAIAFAGCTTGGPTPERAVTQSLPHVLAAARKGVVAGDSAWGALAQTIRRRAERALNTPIRSVMDKEDVPPSGDRHDFLSPAPLWWPDPEQADGLPYVWNRAGQINPEHYERGDQKAFNEMARAVQQLALGYYLARGEAYASHAQKLLHAWFLDDSTRMNPNLNHAWYERGRNSGTPFGIMSLEQLPFLLDAIRMIEGSHSWTDDDGRAMQAWVDAYLAWLTTSRMGTDAARIWNRFGTAYDAQAAACALFLSRDQLARQILERSTMERINRLIRRDGRQPYALEREITFFNSVSSVGYFFQLATMADGLGMDLWHYAAPDGGSLRRALEFVAPYADPDRRWPFILEVRRELLSPVLAQAAVAYDDGSYRRHLDLLPEDEVLQAPIFELYPVYFDREQDTLRTHLMVLDEGVLGSSARRPDDHVRALALLREAAEEALLVAPVSVMQKTMIPPSGSKHDFLSIGGYYWPDPTKPGGLPWIYRDGKVHPDYTITGDGERLRTMMRAVPVLALAFAMTGDERYAGHATRMLREWFLNPATRMNPNLRYAHAHPGVVNGSYYGIIHLGPMPMVMDAAVMLERSASWTEDDRRGMTAWCEKFLDWMLHDDDAPEAGRVWNNHGTNYDLVAVRFALMADRRGLAREMIERAKHERIDRQIRGDGRLPFELERNRAWTYTVLTIDKFVQLATMGDRMGIDLWNYTTPEGGGIRAAIDYLAVYADSSAVWPFADLDFQRSGRTPLARLRSIMQRAALAYDEPRYGERAALLPIDRDLFREADLVYLFYPYAPTEGTLEAILR